VFSVVGAALGCVVRDVVKGSRGDVVSGGGFEMVAGCGHSASLLFSQQYTSRTTFSVNWWVA
jgi:hypothetical protein